MEAGTVATLVGFGLAFTVLNELVTWRLWPRYLLRQQHCTIQRRAVWSTLLIDPLVAAIACPMASDLFFVTTWMQSCHGLFVLFISLVLLVLFVSCLVLSYHTVALMHPDVASLPSSQSDTSRPWKRSQVFYSFVTSVIVNVLLTWIMLAFASEAASNEKLLYLTEGEDCWDALLYESALFYSVVCFALQLFQVVFYGYLSYSLVSKFHHLLHIEIGHENQKSSDSGELGGYSDYRNIMHYTVTSVICLLFTNVIRLSFSTCSCHAFTVLASSVYRTNWFVLAKLPSAGLFYWALTKILNRL